MDNGTERNRAIIRGWIHAEEGLKEVADAKQRLRDLEHQNRHQESVHKRISNVVTWLEWIEINLVNTRLFYMAELYTGAIVEDEESVRRGLVPAKRQIEEEARKAVSRLDTYCATRGFSEIGDYYFKFRETILYTHDRLNLSSNSDVKNALEALFEEVEDWGMTDVDAWKKWIVDRRSDYPHLFDSGE